MVESKEDDVECGGSALGVVESAIKTDRQTAARLRVFVRLLL